MAEIIMVAVDYRKIVLDMDIHPDADASTRLIMLLIGIIGYIKISRWKKHVSRVMGYGQYANATGDYIFFFTRVVELQFETSKLMLIL